MMDIHRRRGNLPKEMEELVLKLKGLETGLPTQGQETSSASKAETITAEISHSRGDEDPLHRRLPRSDRILAESDLILSDTHTQ